MTWNRQITNNMNKSTSYCIGKPNEKYQTLPVLEYLDDQSQANGPKVKVPYK